MVIIIVIVIPLGGGAIFEIMRDSRIVPGQKVQSLTALPIQLSCKQPSLYLSFHIHTVGYNIMLLA
jgi:hypothetical protein